MLPRPLWRGGGMHMWWCHEGQSCNSASQTRPDSRPTPNAGARTNTGSAQCLRRAVCPHQDLNLGCRGHNAMS